MNPEKTGFAMLIVLGGVVFLGYAMFKNDADARQCKVDAASAGFPDCEAFSRAKAAGISENAKWEEKIRQDRDAADQRAKQQDRIAAAKRDMIEREALAKAEMTRNPAGKMNVAGLSWKIGGFGSVGLMTFTVSNQNDFPVKDFVLSCTFSSNSGTQLGTAAHTVYETVKPRSKRSFSDVNVGFIHSQSGKANCDISLAARA